MWWVLLYRLLGSCFMYNARPSDRIVKTSGARAGRPLDRAARGAPTPIERRPYLAVPRERNLKQLLERQSPPRHESSWRFRVDLGYACESALSTGRTELSLCTALSATSYGLGMSLGITLIYPVQCRVATRRTRLTPCACPMFCDDAGLFRDAESCFSGTLPGVKKNPRNAEKKLRSRNFPRNAKKNVRFITTLGKPCYGQIHTSTACSLHSLYIAHWWCQTGNTYPKLQKRCHAST